MGARPCRIGDSRVSAADQDYAIITTFLGSQEARALHHSDLEQQLEGMGHELMRKLLQAHLLAMRLTIVS